MDRFYVFKERFLYTTTSDKGKEYKRG